MYIEWTSSVPRTTLWIAEPTRYESHRVLPDGCMDMIWCDGALLVAGPDTQAQLAGWRPDQRYVGLRFAAGVGPRVFGVPGHAVRDQRVELDDVWPAALVRRLTDQLAATTDSIGVLERAVGEALRRTSPPDPLAAHLWRKMDPEVRIDAIADDVGLSARQLHRRSLDAFGYGLKTLGRIVRMNRAVNLARSGAGLSEVAAVTGYADQAHLSHDVRKLAGVAVTESVTQ